MSWHCSVEDGGSLRCGGFMSCRINSESRPTKAQIVAPMQTQANAKRHEYAGGQSCSVQQDTEMIAAPERPQMRSHLFHLGRAERVSRGCARAPLSAWISPFEGETGETSVGLQWRLLARAGG